MTRLTGQPWLSAPETLAVLDALEAAGGRARFVGGCVRNALIGQPVDDLDIATDLEPQAMIAALKAAGLKAVPTGVEHGTVTAVSGGKSHEVTTLRRDVETDGRRAVVAFTTDWAEDAARRDFRLNALYADRSGEVFDPTGAGIEDALAGRIVFVGEPEPRIREDYLRILRFFRFRAWYGRGEPDQAALKACHDLRAGLDQLSAERIAKEVLKLLAAPDPRPALHLMAETGVLERLFPDLRDTDFAWRLVDRTGDPVLRLSGLLPADAQAAGGAATRLRLSNAQRDRLMAAVDPDGAIRPEMGQKAARAAIHRVGRQAFRDRLTRAWAAADGDGPAQTLLKLAESWEPPVFPVSGADLKARGVQPGPRMGRILSTLETEWVDADFDDAGLDARLEELIAEG